MNHEGTEAGAGLTKMGDKSKKPNASAVQCHTREDWVSDII
jgi:hypothetical protein